MKVESRGLNSRSHAIALAYVTSAFSKIATAAVQLLALPIVATTLGDERFGALLMTGSLGAFLTIPAQGFSPSASYTIAHARGLNNPRLVAEAFWSSLTICFATAVTVASLVCLAYSTVDVALIYSDAARALAPELRGALLALLFHVTIYYAFWWTEGLRAAFQETHVTNFYSMAASLAVVIGVGLCWAAFPTIAAFYLAIFAVPPLFQGISFVHCYMRRRREFGRYCISGSAVRAAASSAGDFSVGQIGTNLYLHGTVYLAGVQLGLAAGALAGGIVRLFIIVNSTLLSILSPVLPTISMARAANDVPWLRRCEKYLMSGGLAFLTIFALAIALAGSTIMEWWLGLESSVSAQGFVALAAMGVFYLATSGQIRVLLALGDSAWGSRRLLVAGVFGTAAGYFLMQRYGLIGLVAAQSTAMCLIGLVPLSIRLKRSCRALL